MGSLNEMKVSTSAHTISVRGGLHLLLEHTSVEMADSHNESATLAIRKSEPPPIALAKAIRANDVAAVQQILRRGANPNVFGKDDTTTPLIEAAIRGYADVMEVILLHGASPRLTDIFYNNALHWAIANCHMDCVVLLLDHGSGLETANEELRTPLMQAAFYGHAKIARYLIDRGAQADRLLNPKDESALTIACERGDIATTEVLLKAGDSNSSRGKELHVALIKAASKGHLEVVKLLLERKAEVNRYDEGIEPPIFAAISGGNSDILKLFISHRVNIEEWNEEGYTPLMMAVKVDSTALVAILLDAGADINKLSQREHDSALDIAVRLDRMAAQDLILSACEQSSPV